LTIDLRAGLRRIKPERRIAQLKKRPAQELLAAANFSAIGRAALLPDTNVYIRSAAGTLPAAVADLLDRGLLFHCSVCVSELATGVGNLHPASRGWAQVRDYYSDLIDSFPSTRLLIPDAQDWAEAGLIAGVLARTQSFQPHQRRECVNDALIFLTAAKAGLPVLTNNRDEFDLIQQLVPQGQFIYF
jgi:predicted nucleic acid-binding protein